MEQENSKHDAYEGEEYIEDGETIEEEIINQDDPAPMEDDDDEDEEFTFHGTKPIEGNEDMVELVDDSVQGFFAHKEPIYAIDINPKHENIIVTGGGDDKSYMWRADSGEQLFEFGGHTDSVTSVAFSSDGEYVASGGMDGKVRLWKVSNGEFINSVEGPDEVVWIQWHPRGYVLLAGSSDGTVWMWQMPSGNVMQVFAGHSAPVTAGLFTPDGKKIVTVSEDGSLIVWDPKTGATILRLSSEDARFHQESITCVAVNKDASLALTGSTDSTAKLVNLNNGNIVASFENHSDSVESVGFCNTMPLAATASVDGKLCIWDVTTMRLRQTCEHDDAIVKLHWNENNPLITTCSADRTLRMWDARTGSCVHKWMGHQDTVLGFVVSSDGSTIITASDDGCSLVFKA
ncbi:uncharacterized protein VTP21DRAFT_2761 [Calcarisporiella thermophila]|uniref:uncharacterized protein n=1 Tax=Calcarisporiella thermophila TaxID=911321 RepID=UPI0037449BE9